MQIKFKETRKSANSCDEYRQILKSGDLKFDLANTSDDVIILYCKNGMRITIDCDKKTGEFAITIIDEFLNEY